ncbi:MAG: DUF1972 domain-containing protein [Lachnospiraceae bacterium]|nr:DUF1972 domain-containing protein [Lachnospiraceae bacterium]
MKRSNLPLRHVYIIGSKSIGLYGGFETFVLQLLKNHRDHPAIRYHVACKANGEGCMDVESLPGAVRTGDDTFTYGNARGFLVRVSEIGAAQAIDYDLKALSRVCKHIETNRVSNPVVYILACRIGPFENRYVKRIHAAGGVVLQNPDGMEHRRKKWNALIRRYWKLSERYAVKHADLVVCDSRHMEAYIRKAYAAYRPRTAYISYGADVSPSGCGDNDVRYRNWLAEHHVSGAYYLTVGRFVRENNYETMIREFMRSHTEKTFVIITTGNPRLAEELQQKLRYRDDRRIRFAGTVYDTELLKQIRENAYGYLHGHEVGGTNPSLLESLASTDLNLILGVGFNREVAGKSALYWKKEEGSLSALIDRADRMTREEIADMGARAKARMRERYGWEAVCNAYEALFMKKKGGSAD